ncbi:MerR family transcriptional regulator [Actinomadura nitritigenes]|uniref:MerR family transcriptional regulator n=1 Tax=Actinomadura nitritigenes TaxID=134602 RepID=A0ABS3REH5_9ACTN|nr:MerR family transcriptional regulator [Actinomadura nitritigenes]MBO2444640.1 MerR family transcriptional regulator [Actinomadura nitritigenes]
MEYPISRVAAMAGISSRTLRHYHDIGLLMPSRVSANGYRWYERRELLRLQRIMLLRELGMPLSDIAAALDGESSELTALRRHREQLAAERDRLSRVLDTVDRTIAGLSGERAVRDEDFFTGLAEAKERLRQDLRVRYGQAAESRMVAAERATRHWTRADYEDAAEQGDRLYTRMSEARRRGAAPGSPEALELTAEHYQGVRALWPADAAGYHALADLITDNPEQRAIVSAVDPDLPPWLAEAVRAYAVQCLGFGQAADAV